MDRRGGPEIDRYLGKFENYESSTLMRQKLTGQKAVRRFMEEQIHCHGPPGEADIEGVPELSPEASKEPPPTKV